MTYDPRQLEMGQKRSLARGRVEYFRVQLGEGDPTEKTNEKHRDMGKDLGVSEGKHQFQGYGLILTLSVSFFVQQIFKCNCPF